MAPNLPIPPSNPSNGMVLTCTTIDPSSSKTYLILQASWRILSSPMPQLPHRRPPSTQIPKSHIAQRGKNNREISLPQHHGIATRRASASQIHACHPPCHMHLSHSVALSATLSLRLDELPHLFPRTVKDSALPAPTPRSFSLAHLDLHPSQKERKRTTSALPADQSAFRP